MKLFLDDFYLSFDEFRKLSEEMPHECVNFFDVKESLRPKVE